MSTETPRTTETDTHPRGDSPNETGGNGGEIEHPAARELSLDHVFEILKNERRREVLHYLRTHEERVTLSDLAEHIAALENDTDVASITSSQRKRVYVGLYQCHLPKMSDMDIVDFNQNRGIVEIGDNASQLFEYLDNDGSGRSAWHGAYFAVAGLGAAAVLVSLALSVPEVFVLGSLAVVTALLGCCAAIDAASRDAEALPRSIRSILPQ